MFDGRWGAYDNIGNERVSGEALGDGSVSINAIVTDHTHNNQPHLYQKGRMLLSSRDDECRVLQL